MSQKGREKNENNYSLLIRRIIILNNCFKYNLMTQILIDLLDRLYLNFPCTNIIIIINNDIDRYFQTCYTKINYNN